MSILLLGPYAKAQAPQKVQHPPVVEIPRGFVVDEEIRGDLNKDGKEDRVYIVRGTDKSKFVDHEFRGRLDRNRRGIIIALNRSGRHEIATANLDCFSSDNEEGGIYYAPELLVSVKNGTLLIHYAHGRYGYWNYTFRFQNDDFELIGHESSSNRGPIVLAETSINFSTKRMRLRENIDRNPQEGSKETFRETWRSFDLPSAITLKSIKDFDELDVTKRLTRSNQPR